MSKNIDKEIEKLRKLKAKEDKLQAKKKPKVSKGKLKKEWRIQRINELISLYSKGFGSGKNKVVPSEKDIKDYRRILESQKDHYLETVGKPYEIDATKTTPFDKLKMLDKNFACLIHIFMDNGTIDSFIVNEKGRTFMRNKMTYLLDKKNAKTYLRKRTTTFFYYQNNPFPLNFEKGILPAGIPDAILLKKTLHFEYLQALANAVRLNKKMDIVFLMSILSFVTGVLILILCLKGFNFV